jgi:hypothetical protein
MAPNPIGVTTNISELATLPSMSALWRSPLPFVLALSAMVFYGTVYEAGIWAYAQEAFRPLMTNLGVRFWRWPFFDLEGVLSWGECHRLGYDVMRVNPCDREGRLLNYSPLFQYLPLGGTHMTMGGGCAIDTLFLATAAFVLQPRSWRELGLGLAALLCPFAIGFALERANIDIAVFLVGAAGVWLTARPGFQRYAGYALYLGAGLLKFYPAILLCTLARERPRMALGLATLSALTIMLFIALFWADLLRIPALLPSPSFSNNMFGAIILPLATAYYLGLAPAAVAIMTLMLTVLATAAAVRFAGSLRPLIAPVEWNTYPFAFLAVGALLIVGTFFTQANIAYRAVFLLFLLPGLLRLRDKGGKTKRIFSFTLETLFLCLWEASIRLPLKTAVAAAAGNAMVSGFWKTLSLAFFFIREAAWWWTVSVLAAVLIVYFAQAPALLPTFAWLMSKNGADRRNLDRRLTHSGE